MEDLRKLAEAATPHTELVNRAIDRMSQGARMILDSIPGDSSLSASSHPREISKAIAAELTALRAKVRAQAEALKPFAEAAKLYNREGVELAHIISVGDLCRAAQEAGNE